MSSKLVKQDINFLEFPLWIQNKNLPNDLENGFVWKDLKGFIYKTGYKPPVKVDLIVLLSLLSKSQKNEWDREIEVSQYEILKLCNFGITQGTYWYKRLRESLERWMHVIVSFEDTFYDGSKRVCGQFHIIDDWKLDKKSKKLKIQLNSTWLEQIKNSTYYKILDFEQIKALRSPLATRLYEILIKTFQSRTNWSIGAKKLAAKIPMKEKYVSHIIPKIKTAVKQINAKTKLQIQLEVKRPERGKAIFYFEKTSVDEVPEKKEVPKELLVESKRAVPKKKKEPTAKLRKKTEAEPEAEVRIEHEDFDELISLLPKEHRTKKVLKKQLLRYVEEQGEDYVRGNILYANANARDQYRSYLTKALKDNWGEGYLEELQEVEEKKRRKRLEEERKRAEEERNRQMEQTVQERFDALSPEEYRELEEKAKAKIEQTHPNLLNSSLASMMLKMQVKLMIATEINQKS